MDKKVPCLDAQMSKKSLRCKKCRKNQLACVEESNMLNSRRDKKGKTEEESPSLTVAGSWAARRKSEAKRPSLALAGS